MSKRNVLWENKAVEKNFELKKNSYLSINVNFRIVQIENCSFFILLD